MASVNVKTVQLRPGRHRSPDEGACVMELASMLAGEPFSDHPRSVSPLIAALLRAYNDLVRRSRRQDLHQCAAEVIGTRASQQVERARAALCVDVLRTLDRGRSLGSRAWLWSTSPRLLRRIADVTAVSDAELEQLMARVAQILARGGIRGHTLLLGLVTDLCAVGTTRQPDADLVCSGRTGAVASESRAEP